MRRRDDGREDGGDGRRGSVAGRYLQLSDVREALHDGSRTRGACPALSQRGAASVRVRRVQQDVRTCGQSRTAPRRPLARAQLRVSAVRQVLQAVVDALHASAHTQRHAPISVSVLRQALPPEVGHEEAHLHTHR